MKTLTKFYNWVMYDGINEKFNDIEDNVVVLDSRLEDIEETMEVLLEKLGVHVHYTIDDTFDEFRASIVDNHKPTAKTPKAKTVKSTPRGKK